MTTEITMPKLGESVVEGVIGRWLKSVGDNVEVDEPIVEIDTDKVNAQMPSPVAGVVEALLVKEGETVRVGTPIAIIRRTQKEQSTEEDPENSERLPHAYTPGRPSSECRERD